MQMIGNGETQVSEANQAWLFHERLCAACLDMCSPSSPKTPHPCMLASISHQTDYDDGTARKKTHHEDTKPYTVPMVKIMTTEFS